MWWWLLMLVLWGCTTAPRPAADIGGDWLAEVRYPAGVAVGPVHLAQNGPTTFTGRMTLDVGPDSGDARITAGHIVKDTVTFHTAACQYTGTMTGSPATRIAGVVACGDEVTGTWRLVR